jgi:hypothetical protein
LLRARLRAFWPGFGFAAGLRRLRFGAASESASISASRSSASESRPGIAS